MPAHFSGFMRERLREDTGPVVSRVLGERGFALPPAGLFAVTSPHNFGSTEVVIFGPGHVGTYLDCQFRSTQQPARLLVTQMPTTCSDCWSRIRTSTHGKQNVFSIQFGPARTSSAARRANNAPTWRAHTMTQWVCEIIGPSSSGSTDVCGCKQASKHALRDRRRAPFSLAHPYLPQWRQLLPELRCAGVVMLWFPPAVEGLEGLEGLEGARLVLDGACRRTEGKQWPQRSRLCWENNWSRWIED
jgi:hypothetical protein